MNAGKVLLVAPGQIFRVCEPSPISIPVKPELLALFSYLKRHGVSDVSLLDVELEDLPFPRQAEDLLRFVESCKNLVAGCEYDVMAISCFTTYSYQSAVMFARISRQIRPDAVIVVGGWHSLSEPEDFARHEGLFDFVIRGEGEKPLLDIAQARLRSSNGHPRIVEAPALSRAEHAAFEYLFEDYVNAAPSRYARAFQTATEAMLPISRGCPFECRFCGNSLHPHREWTPLEMHRSIALIADARRAQPRLETCYFSDAYFGASRKWRREFLEEYTRTYPGLPNVVITRSELLEPRDIELFAKSSTFVLFGVESLAPDILNIMHKTSHPVRYVARTKQALAWMRASCVPHELFMILDHPGETEETLAETCAGLESLMGPWISLVGFRYLHFPQFARHYAEYQQRFGTELRAPLRWWADPSFRDTLALTQYYVPSKKGTETFEQAKERMERAIAPYERLCKQWARRKKHGTVVREGY